MILIFGIFYFLLFMPMQKQKKQQREMLAALQNGNVVQTTAVSSGRSFLRMPKMILWF